MSLCSAPIRLGLAGLGRKVFTNRAATLCTVAKLLILSELSSTSIMSAPQHGGSPGLGSGAGGLIVRLTVAVCGVLVAPDAVNVPPEVVSNLMVYWRVK